MRLGCPSVLLVPPPAGGPAVAAAAGTGPAASPGTAEGVLPVVEPAGTAVAAAAAARPLELRQIDNDKALESL